MFIRDSVQGLVLGTLSLVLSGPLALLGGGTSGIFSSGLSGLGIVDLAGGVSSVVLDLALGILVNSVGLLGLVGDTFEAGVGNRVVGAVFLSVGSDPCSRTSWLVDLGEVFLLRASDLGRLAGSVGEDITAENGSVLKNLNIEPTRLRKPTLSRRMIRLRDVLLTFRNSLLVKINFPRVLRCSAAC